MTQVLNDYYREFLYSASYANSTVSWSNIRDSYRFWFKAYRDTFKHFVQKYYEMLYDFDASKYEHLFVSKLEEYIKNRKNFFFGSPLNQSWNYLYNMLYEVRHLDKECLEAAQSMTFDKFVELSNEFLKEGRFLWFF